jgi:hypothetical protein
MASGLNLFSMHWMTSGGAESRTEKSKPAEAGLVTNRIKTKPVATLMPFTRNPLKDRGFVVSLRMWRDDDAANLHISLFIDDKNLLCDGPFIAEMAL